MGLYTYLILLSFLIGTLILRLSFGYKLLESDTAFIFLNLIGIIVVQGFRRRKLGMRFISKYSMFSKEWYAEFFRMFTEK